MASKKNKGLFVFILIIVLAVAYGVLEFTQPQLFESYGHEVNFNNIQTTQKGILPGKVSKGYIAKLVIKGTIQEANNSYNQAWLLKTITSLKNDPNNKGIILFINSPGGTVYEADEAYLALLDYKKTGKPIYAYFGSMAASGGYYIGCAADRIYANRNTMTGSIGVISGTSVDLTALLDYIGVKSKTIHAGKNKNMGNYNEPLSAEQEKVLQDMADECYDQFTDIVAESRHLSKDAVIKLSDGRVYTANQALRNGLIDKVSTFDECYADMVQNKLALKNYPVMTVEYTRQKTFTDYLLKAFKNTRTEAAAENTALFYYLAE